MRGSAPVFVVALLTTALPLLSIAQSTQDSPKSISAQRPVVKFQLERAGVAVPNFTLEVHEDGTGRYRAEEVQNSAEGDAAPYAKAEDIDRPLTLSSPTAAEIFKLARVLNHFQMDCASTRKNIANTGKKTLSYSGADGAGSCTYNYSDNKNVTALTDTFLSISYTLDEDRKLEFLHRYDRLGLDAETISFQEAVKEGRATELETITPTLSSIAQDPAIMNRVRQRVANLLKRAATKSNKL